MFRTKVRIKKLDDTPGKNCLVVVLILRNGKRGNNKKSERDVRSFSNFNLLA